MDEVLVGALSSAVHERLDYLEMLIADGDTPSLAALAETELARLTIAWRAVLAQHEPDKRGRCTECSGWFRARRFPCSVWVVVHEHLLVVDHTGRHAVANHHAGARLAAS
jgi:hypothetical protein